MLLEFSVANYRSYREKQTLSLIANNRLKDGVVAPMVSALGSSDRTRVLPVAVMYGANASGKSNLLRALSVLRRMVVQGRRDTEPGDRLPVEPFALDPLAVEQPTEFEVLFQYLGKLYRYEVAVSATRVEKEVLHEVRKSSENIIFSREYDAAAESYRWQHGQYRGDERNARVALTRPEHLFVTAAVESNDGAIEPVYRWFKDRLLVLTNSDVELIDPTYTARRILQSEAFTSDTASLLKVADAGVEHVAVNRVPVDDDELELSTAMPRQWAPHNKQFLRSIWPGQSVKLHASISHFSQGREPVELPLEAESAGTQFVFKLAAPILDCLSSGGTLCVDELNSSLHSGVLAGLVDAFQAEAGKTGAQLVFTTHDVTILSPCRFRRDQVVFVEKSAKTGASAVYTLDQFPRKKNESLMHGYLSGRYGAVPHIPATMRLVGDNEKEAAVALAAEAPVEARGIGGHGGAD